MLRHQLFRIFDACAQICEEAGTGRTVNSSMVKGENQRCHISELD
jgi:hypothetical protein